MALPKKKSQLITVNDIEFRWLVTFRNGVLHLTVDPEETGGQLLQAVFEPHDGYVRSHTGWDRKTQRRQIKPSTVHRIIEHASTNGWKPADKCSTPFRMWAWDVDQIVPCSTDLPEDQIPIRDIASDQVCELQFDLSLDSSWRKTLFAADVGKPFPLPDDYFALSEDSRRHGLRYQVFNDGSADAWGGFIVFGIQSVDFPGVVAYTTNNSSIL
ncbi:MAG: hypothetical protein Aurels2KO_43760 [Aureliella sp.]